MFRVSNPLSPTEGFTTIQPDAGTSPVADSINDTLTLTSSDSSVTITGTAATDTINFQVSGTATGLNAQFLTLATSAGLANERVFTPGTSLSAVDGGAGSTYSLNTIQDIRTSDSPTFVGLTLSGLTQGSIIFAGASGVLSQNNTNLFWDNTNTAMAIGQTSTSDNVNSVSITSKLTVDMSGDLIGMMNHVHSSSASIAANLVLAKTRGTNASPTIIVAGDVVGILGAHGYTGNSGVGYQKLAQIRFVSDSAGTVSTTSMPGQIELYTTPDASVTPARAMLVNSTKAITMDAYGTGIAHLSSAGLISSSLIVNADVNAAAAIDRTKLGTGTANHVVINSITGAFSSEATLAVSRGGTNIGSYTAGDLIYASAATTFTQIPIGASGTLLRSTGTAPAWATLATAGIAQNTEAYVTIGNTAGLTAERALTAGTAISITDGGANSTVTINNTGVTSAIGTANQVNVSGATGAVTFSLPQSIATSSSPTFTGLTLSGLTLGSVIFAGTAGLISQDNSNFFYTDADDALGLGPAASTDSHTISGSSIKHRLSVHANKSGTDLVDVAIWNGSTTAAQDPRLDFIRNKNTIASPTVVASGDGLGMISFQGYDGTDYETAANIICEVDGTPGSNDMPGRIIFNTTPDGSATPAEVLKLDNTKLATFSGTVAITAITTGSIIFAGASGLLSQDNTNLFWDDTNNILEVPTIAGGTATATSLTIDANTAAFAYANTGRIVINERMTFNNLSASTAVALQTSLIASTSITTISGAATLVIYPFMKDSRIFKYSVSQILSTNPTMFSELIFTPTANALSDISCVFTGFYSIPQYKVDVGVGNAATTAILCGYIALPKAGPRITGSGTITEMTGYQTWGFNFLTSDVYANNTVTTLYHLNCGLIVNGGTVTTETFINIPNSTTATNTNGIRCTLSTAANRVFINHSGTAKSLHAGNIRFGDTTTPTDMMETLGNARVTGLLKIGADSTAAAAIDVASGQANHIRLAGHTGAPASPTAGDIYYDTTQKVHQFQATIGKEGLVGLINANTADSSAIASTTTETNYSINFSCPANSLTVGKVIRIKASGIYSTTLSPTLQLKAKYGTVTLIDFGAVVCGTSVTNRAFEIEVMFVVRTIGATGTVMATGNLFLNSGATVLLTGIAVVDNNAGTTTIDTTAATNLQISATWSANSASNTTTLENFIVEALG